MERLTAQTISICSNVDFNIPVGEERINLCKAIEDMKEDARKEGRYEGQIEGEDRLSRLITHLISIGKNEDIATVASDPKIRHALYEEYGIS